MRNARLSVLYIVAIFLTNSCVEEISFGDNNFESILVVDATITNENKLQEINLSRTFEFGALNENPEENAQVKVVGNGIEFEFQETEPGTYQSIAPFRALPNVEYWLEITTANGSQYNSLNKKLTAVTQINNLYAERIVNDDGVDGVVILVDSFDPTNTSNYYKYTFEETYKIIAPLWRLEDLYIVQDLLECRVLIEERPEEQKVCFTSQLSIGLNLTTTIGLSEDRVEEHSVNFLPKDNFKISHRYSALVNQFVISEEAYTYLETIQSFSSQGSLFSQVQAGFVTGNISAISNREEKVIGMFDVVSVSSQRLFFNYEDFYPNALLPPFLITCDRTAPPIATRLPDLEDPVCGSATNLIEERIVVYFDEYDGFPEFAGETGIYLVVPRACGDCTALGDSNPPEFWVE